MVCKVKLFWGGRKIDSKCIMDMVMGRVFSGGTLTFTCSVVYCQFVLDKPVQSYSKNTVMVALYKQGQGKM